MNVPLSARDARRSKKTAAASSSAAAPSDPSRDPEVEVIGKRSQADIPVVDVEAEVAPAGTGEAQGDQAPGSVSATPVGQAGDSAGATVGPKKRKAPVGRSEGQDEEEDAPREGELKRKKKKKDRGDGGRDPEPVVAPGEPEKAPDVGAAQGESTPAGRSGAARTEGGLAKAR